MTVAGQEWIYDKSSGYVPNLKFKDGFIYGLIFGGITGMAMGFMIIIGLLLIPLLFK